MAITTAERTQIIELTVLMFNAAPGATYLAQIVALYEGNPGTPEQKLAALANQLSQTSVYNSLHPNFETAEEFAADFLTPLGLQNDDVARDFVIAKFNAGVSKGQIVYEGYAALKAIPAEANNQYTTAATILENKTTVAAYYSIDKDGAATDLTTLQTVVGSVTEDPASVTAAQAAIDNQVISGQTFTLTTGVDTINGTAGNDTINGTDTTATGLDSIAAGAGTDTFNFNDVAGATKLNAARVSLDSVEHVIARSTALADVDGTGWTGVQNLSVLQGTSATVVVGSTTAVDVSGVTGNVTVNGGSSVGVASATANAAVTVGTTTSPAGAVTVSHTKQGTGAINIDGGTDVTVTAGGVTTGVVNIGAGGATTDLPSGAVVVNSTGAASVAATDVTLGAIAVNGGSSVTVNQTATSSSAAAAADTTGATITQSAVTVNGSAATTSVTVTQSAPVAEVVGVAAAAGSKETNVLTFAAVTAGGTVTVGGLTFTAAKDLTAAQVAAAFANLSAGATQGSAPAGNGIYSGTLTAGWTSGAVVASGTNQTVTVSSTTNTNAVDLVVGGTVAPTVVKTDGAAATDAVTGVLGVVGGAVAVNGAIAGTDVLANVALGGFGAGSTVVSDALTTLTLANSNEDVTVTNAAATTLALGLSGAGTSTNGAAANLGATYTTLNVAATGADSYVNVTAGGVQALNVSGDKAVDLTGSTMGALKTVAVTGSAGLTVDASGATVTSVDASGTSGNNSIKVDASKATYSGGTGKDAVTVTAAVSKAISLGGGDDSLTLAAGTTTLGANVSAGDGTDTLVMAAADAATATATTTFETKIDGFEKLSLLVAATDAIDLANMDDISYVISAGNTTSLTLNNMAAGGTLELTATGVLADVNLVDATGTADAFNVVAKVGTADINFGTLDLAGIESLNVTATDTSTKAAINTATMTLKDAALKTVTVTGNANATLVLDANVKALTSVDGSAMTGALTATTNGTVSQTILGGSGKDVLTGNATGNADTLNGGAGNDTLVVQGDLTTLVGGAGADTFNIGNATTNVNSYATITDLAAGDMIKFSGTANAFAASKVSLAETAVFQDYANAAINSTAAGDVSWFQFGGNTYVIENVNDGTSFLNGTDIIVKITGTVDLSTASFSSSADTLLIV